MKVIISGGGIGGLAAALMIAQRSIAASVYEQAEDTGDVGAGLLLNTEAVAVLQTLGLGDALAQRGQALAATIFLDRFGRRVWRTSGEASEHDGLAAYAIARSQLHAVLREALVAKAGTLVLRSGAQVGAIAQDESGLTVSLRGRDGRPLGTDRGDVLIAAEGIHSATRRSFVAKEGAPAWNGLMMWRGIVTLPTLLDGATRIVAGSSHGRFEIAPIAAPSSEGQQRLAWTITARTGEPGKPPRREDWVRPARTADVLEHVARLQIPGFDVAALVKAAPSVWEYPMCDRDPLPSWRHDRVILLGDAAHPMFPIGTFGASDAVLDAAAIAGALVDEAKPIADRLTDYEQQRLPVSRRRQGDARAGGPERVLDRADALAPERDSDLDAAFPEDQRRALALATSADPNSGG